MVKDESGVVNNSIDDLWAEDLDAPLPEAIAESKVHGQLPDKLKRKQIQVGFRELPDGSEAKFKVGLTDLIRDVFEKGAKALKKPLLPPDSANPLDILRCRKRRGEGWSDPITNLDQPLWLTLINGCTRHFGIEYVLAVKINTIWRIAPADSMTPRELLTSFDLDPAQYSLYKPDSIEPLPADTPISLSRGDMFEAQKDGRYGNSAKLQRPRRGSQTIEDDVQALKEAGSKARLFTFNGQKYVEVEGLAAPSPPWSRNLITILIAIPATYPTSGLDAFYIDMSITHSSGSIPNKSGDAMIDGRAWGLISWHYANNRPWNPLSDDLSTHIEHCRGALLHRGVTQ